MAPRPLYANVVDYAPAPIPAPKELVPPTAQQIATAKAHIVALTAHKFYIQSHIDQLETDLKSIDPAVVAAVKIPGYPPPSKPTPGFSPTTTKLKL